MARKLDDATPGNDGQPRVASTPVDPKIAAAFRAGQEAHRKGFKKRAVPPEYRERGRSAEAAAWMQGWDAEDAINRGA